ncbi:MAG: tetratricopeptide repeat protein, partial [Acidobacteriaceae bacterium]|nr:tetratricopeptide repeat protein [Acidobacteriaceae bacterium]
MVVTGKRLALQAAFFLAFTVPAVFSQDNSGAESHRAKELMAEHQFAEAIPIYKKLLKAYPENTGLLLNLALAEQMAGQPARAIPHFESVLKTEPDNVPALLSLSMARLQLSQSGEAIAPLEKVLKLDPENLDAVGMLAEAELNQGSFEEAAEHYRELTARSGADPRAWYGLGKAYESLATRTFARLSQTAPESSYVAILLAETSLQRHRYRSAFFFYREAQSKSSDLPGIHAGLAEVYKNTDHADWAAAEKQREETLPRPDCRVQTPECAFLSQ